MKKVKKGFGDQIVRSRRIIYLCLMFFTVFAMFSCKLAFCGETHCDGKKCIDVIYWKDVINVKNIAVERLLARAKAEEPVNVTIYLVCDNETWGSSCSKAKPIVNKACNYLKTTFNINCQIKDELSSWKSNETNEYAIFKDLRNKICNKHKSNITLGFTSYKNTNVGGLGDFDKGCSLVFNCPYCNTAAYTAVVLHEWGHNYGLVREGKPRYDKNCEGKWHCNNDCGMKCEGLGWTFSLCKDCQEDWYNNRKKYK